MSSIATPVIRGAIGLGLFAVITVGLIAVTQHWTADAIQTQRERAQAAALLAIVPDNLHDNRLLDDRFRIPPTPELGLADEAVGYRARRGEDVVGVILPVVAPDGYAGPIRLLVGIGRDGEVLGVRVLAHRETPGLGDKIEIGKSDWLRTFAGKSLERPAPDGWDVRKNGGEFDQFTGATITPSAVVRAVKRTLEYFSDHRAVLLGTAPMDTASALSKNNRESGHGD